METKQKTLAVQGVHCALTLAAAMLGIVALLALIGWLIEHQREISQTFNNAWYWTLRGFSFGGHFWGAVTSGALGLATSAWVCCVFPEAEKYPDRQGVRNVLICVGLGGLAVWLLAYLALQSTFVSVRDLSGYGVVAVFAMTAPIVGFALAFFLGFIEAVGASID